MSTFTIAPASKAPPDLMRISPDSFPDEPMGLERQIMEQTRATYLAMVRFELQCTSIVKDLIATVGSYLGGPPHPRRGSYSHRSPPSYTVRCSPITPALHREPGSGVVRYPFVSRGRGRWFGLLQSLFSGLD